MYWNTCNRFHVSAFMQHVSGNVWQGWKHAPTCLAYYRANFHACLAYYRANSNADLEFPPPPLTSPRGVIPGNSDILRKADRTPPKHHETITRRPRYKHCQLTGKIQKKLLFTFPLPPFKLLPTPPINIVLTPGLLRRPPHSKIPPKKKKR